MNEGNSMEKLIGQMVEMADPGEGTRDYTVLDMWQESGNWKAKIIGSDYGRVEVVPAYYLLVSVNTLVAIGVL